MLSQARLATARSLPAWRCCAERCWSTTGDRGVLVGSAFHSSSDANLQEPYDVVVVGGGMVGAAIAAALGTSKLTAGLRVAVIDRTEPRDSLEPLPETPDLRVSTLTPASVKLLADAGAWRMLAPPVGAAFRDMQVWDDRGPGYVRYDAAEAGAAEMGHVVENGAIQSALLRALEDDRASGRRSVDFIWPASVESLSLPSYGSESMDPSPPSAREEDPSHPASSSSGTSSSTGLAEIRLEGGQTLQTRLVVGADGAGSRIRAMAGLRTLGWQYGQRGVVASVRTGEPNATAWQSFLATGPLALLPVRGGFSNIVWSTTPELAKQLEGMSPEEFAAAVNAALAAGGPDGAGGQAVGAGAGAGGLSGPFAALGRAAKGLLSAAKQPPFVRPPRVVEYVGSSPKSFPLQMVHTGRYVRPRLALVGDAAHAVHPLAGQGVNLGFGDAEALAKAVAYAVQVGADVGDAAVLRSHYEQPRQQANLVMMGAIDSLKRIFGLQVEPIAGLRNLGLQLINATPPARQKIVTYAMGTPPF